MDREERAYDRRWLIGCGLPGLVITVGLLAVLIWIIRFDFEAVAYPNAVPVPGWPKTTTRQRFWQYEASYVTSDPLDEVRAWYTSSLKENSYLYGLSDDRCVLMLKKNEQLVVNYETTVVICDNPQGQHIFVVRGLRLARPIKLASFLNLEPDTPTPPISSPGQLGLPGGFPASEVTDRYEN